MTVATAIPCPQRHQAPLDRLALRLGLALVGWAQRPVADVSREDEHRLDSTAHELLAVRDLQRATQGYRLF